MPDNTCAIEHCEKPRYQRRIYCSTHAMRIHRYGDPHWEPSRKWRPLEGQRFGRLVVIRRESNGWVCLCDCGAETFTRTNNLTTGNVVSCGDHRRQDNAGYTAAHDRVRRDRGRSALMTCVDCGAQAKHWSYDHNDPDERRSAEGLAYSLDPLHYSPRCVPCHKRMDLDHLAVDK